MACRPADSERLILNCAILAELYIAALIVNRYSIINVRFNSNAQSRNENGSISCADFPVVPLGTLVQNESKKNTNGNEKANYKEYSPGVVTKKLLKKNMLEKNALVFRCNALNNNI